MKIKQYSKTILEQINEGIKGTGYQVSGDIQIEYKDGDNLVKFNISNQGQ